MLYMTIAAFKRQHQPKSNVGTVPNADANFHNSFYAAVLDGVSDVAAQMMPEDMSWEMCENIQHHSAEL